MLRCFYHLLHVVLELDRELRARLLLGQHLLHRALHGRELCVSVFNFCLDLVQLLDYWSCGLFIFFDLFLLRRRRLFRSTAFLSKFFISFCRLMLLNFLNL